MLSDTNKKDSTMSYKNLTKEFTRNKGGCYGCIAIMIIQVQIGKQAVSVVSGLNGLLIS